MRGRLVSSLLQLAGDDNGMALESAICGILRGPLALTNFLFLFDKVLGRFSFPGPLSCHDLLPKKGRSLKSSVVCTGFNMDLDRI